MSAFVIKCVVSFLKQNLGHKLMEEVQVNKAPGRRAEVPDLVG